jgi:hypothetical protein
MQTMGRRQVSHWKQGEFNIDRDGADKGLLDGKGERRMAAAHLYSLLTSYFCRDSFLLRIPKKLAGPARPSLAGGYHGPFRRVPQARAKVSQKGYSGCHFHFAGRSDARSRTSRQPPRFTLDPAPWLSPRAGSSFPAQRVEDLVTRLAAMRRWFRLSPSSARRP